MVTDATLPTSPAQVHMLQNRDAGLDGMIVLHSTALGPAAGGCRLWSYETTELMAVDAFRLAEGMSYKNALADLPLGGGKAVIQRPAGAFDRERLFAAFGRAVETLHGAYVTAEDVGTCVDDMRWVARSTSHVAGLPPFGGRPGGDPSPWTARGVFVSMQKMVERRLGKSIGECRVAIQGVGNVGASLAAMLHAAGTRLVVADIDVAGVQDVVAHTGATAVAPDAILSANADVFAPCALGAVLDHHSISALRAKVVCGAANNQLATSEDGQRLADKGVLYAPDYVVNAGGIINVAAEYLGWSSDEVTARVEATGDRLVRVLDLAQATGISTDTAADRLARTVIANGVMTRQAA